MLDDKNISRRTFLKQLGFAALAASPVASLLSSCAVGKDRRPTLTILHTNDVHSRIDPFPPDDPRYHGLGGYARRQALIDDVIRRCGADNVLVFESGDMFQGTPYFNYYRGTLEMQLMNRMHVDAVTIGNHEFDNGVDALCDCMQIANFPFVNANYVLTHARARDIIKPYLILHRAGLRIGVFGLGVKLAGLVSPRNCEGFLYQDPIETAVITSAQLRAEGCQLVIALTHIGHEMGMTDPDDIKLAKSLADIDIILGGHTHTFLPAPVRFTNALGHDVVVNQVGFGGINVGMLQLSVLSNNEKLLAFAENKTIGA